MSLHEAYAAGFFDGEGSVYTAPRSSGSGYSLLVCIGNTNRDVLEQHKATWGGSICARKMTKPRHQQQYQWVLSGKMGEPYLRAILPHLIIKREVVQLALKWCEMMNSPYSERVSYETGRPASRPEYLQKAQELRSAIQAQNSKTYNAMRMYGS